MRYGRRHAGESGQSLIESCLVIAVLCVLFFGMVQMSRLFVAGEIIDFAAARGARAKAVGFNDFMIYKVVRVATIANAGPMKTPGFSGSQFRVERRQIPLYLGAEYKGRLKAILDYEDWETVEDPEVRMASLDPPEVAVRVRQYYPLKVPMHRMFFADDNMWLESRMGTGGRFEGSLESEVKMGGHYALYLDDEGR